MKRRTWVKSQALYPHTTYARLNRHLDLLVDSWGAFVAEATAMESQRSTPVSPR